MNEDFQDGSMYTAVTDFPSLKGSPLVSSGSAIQGGTKNYNVIHLTEAKLTPNCPIPLEIARWLDARKIADVSPSHVPNTFDIFPKNVCGIVQHGNYQFEISPKVSIPQLMALLVYSCTGKIWDEDKTNVQSEDISTLFIDYFCTILNKEFSRGVLRGYHDTTDTLNTIRGRLRIEDQLKRRYLQPQPLEVFYSEFSVNIPENQLLICAIEQAIRKVKAVDSKSADYGKLLQRLYRLKVVLNGVTPLPAKARKPKWSLNSLNQRYSAALNMAEMIIEGTGFATTAGDNQAHGILLKMWRIFELVIVRAMRESFPELRIMDQQEHPLFVSRGGEVPPVIRPDVEVRDANNALLALLDIKYKRGKDTAKKSGKLERNDIYQVMAYSKINNINHVGLIYTGTVQDSVEFKTTGTDPIHITQSFVDLAQPIPVIKKQVQALLNHELNLAG